jgi:hypothetical protein
LKLWVYSGVDSLVRIELGIECVAPQNQNSAILAKRVFEKRSSIALPRPGLKIGANSTKSTEGTKSQPSQDLQSVSTDFVLLDRDLQSRAG